MRSILRQRNGFIDLVKGAYLARSGIESRWLDSGFKLVRTMEIEIVRMMKLSAGTAFSYKVIGKLVARNEFRDNPHWARPYLEKLVFERQILKDSAHYYYPTEEQKIEHRQSQRRQQFTAGAAGTC